MNLLPVVKGSVDVATIDGLLALSKEIREAATEPEEVTRLLADLDVVSALLRKAPEVAGLAAIEAEKRRAEVRYDEITKRLQHQVDGGTRPGAQPSRTTVRDAHRMAVNKPIVERVIAESDDASPPTRRKVKKAIDAAEGKVVGHIISLTLCDATHRFVAERADAAGVSLPAYLSRQIDRMAEKAGQKQPIQRRSTAPAQTAGGCAHSKWSVIGGGLRSCNECGSVRGPDGAWRATVR